MEDPTWLSDERLREIKHGDDATRGETLALAGEVRVRRRAIVGVHGRALLALVLVAAILGALRLYGEKSQAFQADAHLYVGGLFTAWIVGRQNWRAGVIGIALTMLEIGCAVASRVR